ncbi:MAG TPA: hypothetical protein VFU07_08405 [Candidatus Lumbricidophila sp.]|nr:hypothetical protein [Candidatus Lumbricidophila sp.]
MSIGSCVVDTSSLSVAELSAVRIDGDLRVCAGAFVPLDEPDLPGTRALSVRSIAPAGPLVVEHLSAAWVHGLVSRPPALARFAVSITERGRFKPPLPFHLREVVIDESEVCAIAGVPVTSPERTCIDLLRDDERADVEVVAIVGECARVAMVCVDGLAARLNASFRLPRKALAHRRLAMLRDAWAAGA